MIGQGRRWVRYDGDELERRGLAAHDSGDGGVALLGPVDAGAVPRPSGIRPGLIGGWTRLAAPEVFELPRRDVRAARGVEHPLHRGQVDGASFGTGLRERILARPHGAGPLATLPRDLVLGQPPVGFERFLMAPLGDGPAQVGRPAPHGRAIVRDRPRASGVGRAQRVGDQAAGGSAAGVRPGRLAPAVPKPW